MSSREAPTAVHDASWYHTIELPDGTVTAGEYDLRPTLARIPFPPALQGARCLDVGTRDGFWAFAMEQRGAREVVAIDLDDHERLDFPEPRPDLGDAVMAELAARRRAFGIAHAALDSRVERLNLSVYDLDPEEVGHFDFVFFGTLLLHLRDPIGALMAVRRVLRGTLLLNEPIAPALHLRRGPAAALLTLPDAPFWWLPNRAALQQYLRRAGYDVRAAGRPYFVGPGAAGAPAPQGSRWSPAFLRALVMHRLGMPHAWVVAQPRRHA